ncbi:MAG TPA: hypothetical protein VF610_09520, partial [Segetibacter sp.]
LQRISSRSSVLSFRKRQLYSQTISQRYAYKGICNISEIAGVLHQQLEFQLSLEVKNLGKGGDP